MDWRELHCGGRGRDGYTCIMGDIDGRAGKTDCSQQEGVDGEV